MSRRRRSIPLLVPLLLLCLLTGGPAWGRDWVGDAGELLASPARWDGADWSRAGGVLLLTGLAFQADDAVREQFLANQGPTGDTLARIGNGWGNLASLGGVTLLSLYGTGVTTDNRRLVGLSANGLEAVVLSGLVTGIGKLAFGRLRPADAPDSHQWQQGGYSFPSGHTTAAFALSTVLAESGQAPGPGRRIFFYSLAGLTALARMYDNRHWLSDTIMGAAVGIYSGLYVVHRHPLDGDEAVMILPLPNGIAFVRRLDL
jgi:membrane-associated phospholipid phosphatase